MTPEQRYAPLLENLHQRSPGQIRIFHGRGGSYPGLEHLNLDLFGTTSVLTTWKPLEVEDERFLCESVSAALGADGDNLLLQERHIRTAPIRALLGEIPSTGRIREDGLEFLIHFDLGQNLGFFPDMAAGRRWVRQLSSGKRVLNLFAYTCTLSVAALAGGAQQVTNLDMSRSALSRGRENHRLNDLPHRGATFLGHDLFKSFGKLRRLGPFDLIILDPPAAQGKSFLAGRDWPKILRRLPELLGPEGLILAAVSAPELGRAFLRDAFAEALPEARSLSHRTAGEDFPESDPDKGLHLLLYRLPATETPRTQDCSLETSAC